MDHSPIRKRPVRKPTVPFLRQSADGDQSAATIRPGKRIIDLLDEGWGRDPESLRKTEHHIQRWCPDRFFKPRNVASFQAAIACKIRLAPPLANTSPGDDLGEARTELVGIMQATSLQGSIPTVAVTIGPAQALLPLTLQAITDQIVTRSAISSPNPGSTTLKSH